jgi:hypothetical protein
VIGRYLICADYTAMMIMQHMNDLYLRRCDQQLVVIQTVQEELLRKFYESPMYDFLLEGMDRREGRMTLRRGCFQKLLRTVGVLARSLSAHKRPRHITPTEGLREEVKHVVIFNSSSLDIGMSSTGESFGMSKRARSASGSLASNALE